MCLRSYPLRMRTRLPTDRPMPQRLLCISSIVFSGFEIARVVRIQPA